VAIPTFEAPFLPFLELLASNGALPMRNLCARFDTKRCVTSFELTQQVHLPGGASEQTVRTVTENARTLRFTSQAFEEE
jgi:hypothetical protein